MAVVVRSQNRFLVFTRPRSVPLRAWCAECGMGAFIGHSEGVLAVVLGFD